MKFLIMLKPFFVIDTNCFISANLIKNSASADAFDKALLIGIIALSDKVLNEYTDVLYREKLDKYLSLGERQIILKQLNRNAIFFTPVETITDCRDPEDNIFFRTGNCLPGFLHYFR